MKIEVLADKPSAGEAAAAAGVEKIKSALEERGFANLIVATGASQFEVLSALAAAPNVRWDKVTIFHLDEYVGLPITHPASFRRYLWERFHLRLPLPVRAFHYLDAENDPAAE